MMAMLCLAQHALFAYQYHSYFPAVAKVPHALAEYFANYKGLQYGDVHPVLQAIEGGVDGVYFVALVAAVLMSKQFVDERRDERKAREVQAEEEKLLREERPAE